MPRPKSQLEYIARYKKEHMTKVGVEFHKGRPEEMEMLAFLNTKPSKQGYLKELIKKAMIEEEQKHTPTR